MNSNTPYPSADDQRVIAQLRESQQTLAAMRGQPYKRYPAKSVQPVITRPSQPVTAAVQDE